MVETELRGDVCRYLVSLIQHLAVESSLIVREQEFAVGSYLALEKPNTDSSIAAYLCNNTSLEIIQFTISTFTSVCVLINPSYFIVNFITSP